MASTVSFGALPRDIVRHILSLIPLRPRLLVAARVCKRWHREAIDLVEEIRVWRSCTEEFEDVLLFGALPNYTALRRLELRTSIPTDPIVPTSLQHLSLAWSRDDLDAPAMTPLLALPRLTSLRFFLWHEEAMQTMLQRYASVLESLLIASFVQISIFAGLRFPALRTLELWTSAESDANDVAAFFMQVQSQLTSLSVRAYSPLFPPGVAFSFPLLKELHITDYNAQKHAALIAGCGPTLKVAVQAITVLSPDVDTAPWLSRLTHLDIGSYTRPFPFQLAPQLRSVKVDLVIEESPESEALLSGLHKCPLTRIFVRAAGTQRLSQLASMTQLTELWISGIDRLECDATLPSVRELIMRHCFHFQPGSAAFEALLAGLRRFPMLSQLSVHWTYPDEENVKVLTEDVVALTIDRILTLAPQLELIELAGKNAPASLSARRRWPWCEVSTFCY